MKAVLNDKRLAETLTQLENAIDPDIESKLHAQWLDFTFDKFNGDLFIAQREKAHADLNITPSPHVNDTLEFTSDGLANMLVSQYNMCLSSIKSGNGILLSVRSNYGTGIIPSIFGCETFVMPRETNTLPGTIALGAEAIPALLDKGVPDVLNGVGRQVIITSELIKEIGLKYPKIGKFVHPFHPDLQGPMDIAELIWGSSIFYDLYDQPELIHAFLQMITQTYIAIMDKWLEIFPVTEDHAFHWGMIHRGTIMLRDDSAMNLSPDMFKEFIYPYDNQLLNHYGGGAVHFCGKGDHFIEFFTQMDKLYAVNMSQPEYNDMETIYRNTVDKNIKLISLDKETAIRDRKRLKGKVNVIDYGVN